MLHRNRWLQDELAELFVAHQEAGGGPDGGYGGPGGWGTGDSAAEMGYAGYGMGGVGVGFGGLAGYGEGGSDGGAGGGVAGGFGQNSGFDAYAAAYNPETLYAPDFNNPNVLNPTPSINQPDVLNDPSVLNPTPSINQTPSLVGGTNPEGLWGDAAITGGRDGRDGREGVVDGRGSVPTIAGVPTVNVDVSGISTGSGEVPINLSSAAGFAPGEGRYSPTFQPHRFNVGPIRPAEMAMFGDRDPVQMAIQGLSREWVDDEGWVNPLAVYIANGFRDRGASPERVVQTYTDMGISPTEVIEQLQDYGLAPRGARAGDPEVEALYGDEATRRRIMEYAGGGATMPTGGGPVQTAAPPQTGGGGAPAQTSGGGFSLSPALLAQMGAQGGQMGALAAGPWSGLPQPVPQQMPVQKMPPNFIA